MELTLCDFSSVGVFLIQFSGWNSVSFYFSKMHNYVVIPCLLAYVKFGQSAYRLHTEGEVCNLLVL